MLIQAGTSYVINTSLRVPLRAPQALPMLVQEFQVRGVRLGSTELVKAKAEGMSPTISVCS